MNDYKFTLKDYTMFVESTDDTMERLSSMSSSLATQIMMYEEHISSNK